MAGTKNVPGAQNCGVQTARGDELFAERSDFDIRFHRRRGMRDADIYKVLKTIGDGSCHGFLAGLEIDVAKLLRFGWTGMCDTDELHKSVVAGDLAVEGISI